LRQTQKYPKEKRQVVALAQWPTIERDGVTGWEEVRQG
jgi:hypothetical protein